ncbi:MAG: MFS transporter [Chlamydiota bacterium]
MSRHQTQLGLKQELTQQQQRSRIALLAILFVDNLALAVVYPLFTPLILKPIYSLLPAHFSPSTRLLFLALLIASFPLAQFFGGPFIGNLADTMTRKKAFLIALVGELIGFFLSAFAMEQLSYPLLLCSRLVTGFFAGNLLLCLVSLADLSYYPKQRAKNFGLVATFSGAGFVIAIILGGLLSDSHLDSLFSSALPFYLTGALVFINIAILLLYFTETKAALQSPINGMAKHCKQITCILKTKKLGALYITFFFFMLGWTLTLQFLPTLLIEHFSAKKIIIALTFIGLGVTWCFSNTLVNRFFLARFQSTSLILSGLILSTLCLFIVSQARSLLFFFHLILIGTLGASLTWTNCLTLISSRTPISLQGKMLGIAQSVAAISMIFAPLFGGLVGEYDIWTIYIAAASSLLIATLTFNPSYV